jgi:hypothetical protein
MRRFVKRPGQRVARGWRPTSAAVAASTAIALTLAAGCGNAAQEDAAAAAARAFHGAVVHKQGAKACDLLAPQTRKALERLAKAPCAKAVLTGKLAATLTNAGDVRKVSLAGDQAQVALARDTVFLTVLAENWKVVAAGCRPRGGQQPYACLIAGS